MSSVSSANTSRRRLRLLATALLAATLSSASAWAVEIQATLSGASEVPSVMSAATGTGTITVGDDGAISGSIRTMGVAGTAAHIHEGGEGSDGPVLITLTKDGDTYTVPPGSMLTEAQIATFKAGRLYINVHSTANPNGAIRGQLHAPASASASSRY